MKMTKKCDRGNLLLPSMKNVCVGKFEATKHPSDFLKHHWLIEGEKDH